MEWQTFDICCGEFQILHSFEAPSRLGYGAHIDIHTHRPSAGEEGKRRAIEPASTANIQTLFALKPVEREVLGYERPPEGFNQRYKCYVVTHRVFRGIRSRNPTTNQSPSGFPVVDYQERRVILSVVQFLAMYRDSRLPLPSRCWRKVLKQINMTNHVEP